MDIHLLINQLQLRPADAVALTKKFLGMVDHYVIFLGFAGFTPQFVANYFDGVRIIPQDDIKRWLMEYVPTKVDRFPGTEDGRREALVRATSRIGEKAYNYVANNCEHFKNFVHYGIGSSSQVSKFGGAMMLCGIGVGLMGLGRKNDNLALWGLLIAIIGAIIASLGVQNSGAPGNKLLPSANRP